METGTSANVGQSFQRPTSQLSSSNVTTRSNDPSHRNGDTAALMEPTMKCMAVFEEGTKIAFACYDEDRNEILLEESLAQAHDTESIVQGFVSIARPNLVLVGSKIASNTPLLDLLTRSPPQIESETLVNGESQTTVRQTANAQKPSNPGTSTGNGNSEINHPRAVPQPSIAYRLLKTGAFDLRNCKFLVLNKLRVLTLMRDSGSSRSDVLTRNCGGNFHMGGNGNNFISHHHAGVGGIQSRQRIFPNSTGGHMAAPPSRYHALASVVDFDSTVILRALGSLLSFLQSSIFRLEEGSTVTINAIRYAQSSRFMRIDAGTLRALHIFSTEHHPLLAKGRGNAKEGYSLFTLLDKTKSKMGRNCLREWMLKPLLDPSEIEKRYDGIELFLKPDFHEPASLILNLLQRVGAVDKILIRMQKCISAPMDFLIISHTLSAAVAICTALEVDFKQYIARNVSLPSQGGSDTSGNVTEMGFGQHSASAMRDIAFLDGILQRCHVPVLKVLHERIVSIVDEESTAETRDSVVIHFGFHDELDNAKEAFDVLDATLSAVGSQVLNKHPELRQVKVVFLPQVGFLITIDKRNHSHNVATNEFPDLPPDFTFVFTQDNDAYFKNPDMRQLDDEIGDLDAFIKDTESMIVSDLEEDILDCESELRSTFGALAELDCILSFASCAADLNFVRPKIFARNRNESRQGYSIENGRHPLQELIIDDEFIANDTLVDSDKRVNVVTGPNFSGKSCYTRQVGILVYLAHIGCYLPCDNAEIEITDQILARISSVETCAVPQSSFQLDLTQMATILRKSTPRTLVLIDEFGKGTAPASGIAVLTAALKKLLTIGCKVICTTHFLEIFSLGLLSDGINGIKVLQMAVHVPDSEDDNAVPLFKLEDGVANSSAGLVCAKMAGVSKEVIGRAKEILGALKDGQPVLPIPPSLNSNSAFQPSAKATLRLFLGLNSWTNASNEELKELQRKILLM